MLSLIKSATSIFRNTQRETFAEILKVDVGSNIIPGLDFSSPNIKTSLQFLETMNELGYQKVITTPVITTPKSNQLISSGLSALKNEMKMNKINIKVEAAGEYPLDKNFEKLLDERKLLSFGLKNYVLIKMSFNQSTPNLGSIIFKIATAGYTPILAHSERYTYWHQNYRVFPHLQEIGCLTHVSIPSLLGHYGASFKNRAAQLIKSGCIDFLGSNLSDIRDMELLKNGKYNYELYDYIKNSNFKNHLLL